MPFAYAEETQHHSNGKRVPGNAVQRPRAAPDLPLLDLSSPPQVETSHRAARADTIVLDDDDNDDEDMYEVHVASDGVNGASQAVDVAERPASNAGAAAGSALDLQRDQEEDEKLSAEIASIRKQKQDLEKLEATLMSDRAVVRARIKSRQRQPSAPSAGSKPQAPPRSAVDYTQSSFSWSQQLKKTLRGVWGLQDFRMCQEAAINASLDGREVVAVLPTGGGKSLIYQLPAVLSSKGTTIVITPLISLMDDQVFNLRQKGIAAEQLHAAVTQEESRSIMKRMLGDSAQSSKGKKKAKQSLSDDEGRDGNLRTPKLVYVTPERIEKSKTFVNTLQKMYDAGILTRFVIDEAHSISTLGHDYRTSYLALKRLKALFPTVPIIATTATAPASVVQDMLKVLALPRVTSTGEAAVPGTTVLFTAPLYRANLRYEVLPKPTSAVAQIKAIAEYIQNKHPDDVGIVYCLTRADTENVAKGLNEHSKDIRAAMYHAQLDDAQKLRVYDHWRKRKIRVVVATQASFGLGIDNPNVRFVIHHTIAKSLSNYYQESGRAGRDGLEADCVLFWRAADASRVSTMIYESYYSGGKDKLHEMVKFAEDLSTCRKIAFARSFAATHASSSAFVEGDEAAEPCGHCDNCRRPDGSWELVDVSPSAYRALRIIEAAGQQNATLTLPQAADLIRGLQKGSFSTQEAKGKGKGSVDVVQVAGGKVEGLDKDGGEALIMKLLLDGYLEESFHATAYSTISYLGVTSRAKRFTRLPPDQVDKEGLPASITMIVLVSDSGKAGGKKRKANAGGSKPQVKKKRKTVESVEHGTDNGDEGEPDGFFFDSDGLGDADEDAEEALAESFASRGRIDDDG